METLEELKNTYKKLQEESNNLYSKIKALEKRNAISKFTVGDCYLNTKWNDLIKIVSIKDNYIYYICLDKDCITRDYSYIYDIEDWEKIIDEDGRVGQLSRIIPYRSPSERFMCATLSLTLFFHMEKKDGTYDNREVYVHGFPIKL